MFEKKKKMPGYLFCFYCFQFSSFIFSSPCVSLPSFSGRTVPACSLLLTKSQREIENHCFSVEARVGILCFHCTISSAISFFFFSFLREEKKKGTLLELYSVALDDCDVQSGSNYVEKQKETYLPIGNACFFRAFIWAFSETHRVKSFFTPFTCLGGRGGTGLTTLLACRGCAWTALYSKYRFKMLEPPQAQACRFP